MFVVIVTAMALIGQKTYGLSISLMGSTMIISGSLSLIKSIILQVATDQDSMKSIMRMFAALELPLSCTGIEFRTLTVASSVRSLM